MPTDNPARRNGSAAFRIVAATGPAVKRRFPSRTQRNRRSDTFRMKLGSLSLFGHHSPRSSTDGKSSVSTPRSSAYRIQVIAQLCCILTIIALWPHVAMPMQLAVWWLGMTVAQLLLAGLVRPLLSSRAQRDELFLHHYLYSASAVIGGAAWGSLPLVGPYEANAAAQMILFMVLGGITLAGAAILADSRSAYAMFVSATLLPLFILTLVNPPPALPQASVWLMVFVVLAFTLNDILHSGRRTSGRSRREISDLAMTRQTMLEHSSEAILLSRSMRILHSNRRFATMLHDGHAPLPGSRLQTWFAQREDWKVHARAASRSFRRGATYREPVRLRRRDGSVFWAEVSGQMVNPGAHPLQVVWVVRDITERMNAAAREAIACTQLQALIGQSADWYWQTDAQHVLMQVSGHAGLPDDPLKCNVGRPWWQFQRPGGGSPAEQATVRRSFESAQGFRNLLVEVPAGDRPPLWLNICGTPRFNEHGSFLGHHGTATDVTDQLRGSERIHHLAYHDPLTGLPNRRLLTDRLTQAIARAQRYRERVGVILIDLDNFKRINDMGGHAAGDQVLLETADRLRSCLRTCDTAARLGGDSFVVLLSELDLPSDADHVAAKIHHAMHQPLQLPAPRVPLSTSIGIAIFPEDAIAADSLLEVADTRMYRAKRRGGQRIEHA
jgi:diguanylate cyclase (GGDEF)-like protein/PAS domain S-box-containing protein